LIKGTLVAWIGMQLAGAGELLNPPAIWKDYDPDKGDFKEEIVKQETKNGIFYRESYISAYVLNEDIRVFCKYSVKEGVADAPGLLDVHGWMGAPNVSKEYVNSGWAVMAHDYCGKTENRTHYTKYPERLRHGNMDDKYGPVIHDSTPDRKSITDPKQTSEYVWYAMQRRVLSYLERQKQVDKTRLGATGYSYGGTLMWALGTDPRIKAIVAHFGIG
jgi:dienelactone hydrolase